VPCVACADDSSPSARHLLALCFTAPGPMPGDRLDQLRGHSRRVTVSADEPRLPRSRRPSPGRACHRCGSALNDVILLGLGLALPEEGRLAADQTLRPNSRARMSPSPARALTSTACRSLRRILRSRHPGGGRSENCLERSRAATSSAASPSDAGRRECASCQAGACGEASPHRDDQRAGTVEARNARLHVDSVRGQLAGY
jgi:hypothetical protein